MSNKRDPRALVNFDTKDFKNRQFANPDLSTPYCRTEPPSGDHKGKMRDCHRNPNPSAGKTPVESTASGEALRARWFENADHDKIKRQLNGTFTYRKPEFGCPLRSQISGAFTSVGAMTPNKWSETVRALSALCTQNRAYTPRQLRARRTCTYSATTMTSYRLQTGFTRSFHLQPSGSMLAREIYLSLSIPSLCAYAPPW